MKNFFITVLLLIFIMFPNFGFAQIYTKLFDFDGNNGYLPYSTLVGDGTYFYGMTQIGGTENKGVIYKIKKNGTGYQKLLDFDGTNGSRPYDDLTLIGSQLFGVTYYGGTSDLGVIFRINTDGTGFTKLLDNNVGGRLNSSLYYDGTYLYGTINNSRIYKIKPDGTGYELVHSFSGSTGSRPQGNLEFDGTYFYGSLYIGGAENEGALYKIKTDGTDYQIIHNFENVNIEGAFNTGSQGLLLHNGYLYGNTFTGGENSVGFIYRIKTDGTEYQILHSFGIETSSGNKPMGELIFAGEYLYGTTSRNGGSGGVNSLNGTGSVFRIKPDGSDYSSFNLPNGMGTHPWCGVYYDNDGIYGVAATGGSNGRGTIFKFNDDNIELSAVSYSKNNISIFPNPAKSVLNIDVKESGNIKIIDISGKIVSVQKLNIGRNKINVSNLAKGAYFLYTENGFTTKFVKE